MDVRREKDAAAKTAIAATKNRNHGIWNTRRAATFGVAARSAR